MAARYTHRDTARPPVRFCLVTATGREPGTLAERLAPLLVAADVAAVLARIEPASERAMIEAVKRIAPTVQGAGAALLIAERADLVARAGADGAHLGDVAAFLSAAPGLKPSRIAGAGGLHSRHDAMVVGEAGADYVLFGEPDANGRRALFDAVTERVRWWAELFEIPCVAWAASLDEAAPLAAAGADFIALDDELLASDPRGAVAALRDAANRLSQAEALA